MVTQPLEAGFAVHRGHLDHVAAQQLQHCEPGAEEPAQIPDDPLEHRLRIGHRAADRCQHVGRGPLLLQRLLGLAVSTQQRLLSPLAERDVAGRAHQLGRPAIGVTHRTAAVVHPAIVARRIEHPDLELQVRAEPLEMLDHGLPIRAPVLRMDALHPMRVPERAAVEAPDFSRPIRQVELAGVDLPLVDALRGRTRGERIALLARLQRLLDELECRDVAGGSDHPDDAPRPVAHGDPMLPRPAPGAVERPIAVVAFEAIGAALEVSDQCRVVRRQVLGVYASAPVLRRAVHLRRHSGCGMHALGVVDRSVEHVPVVDAFVDGAHHDVIALLALPKAFLRVLQCGRKGLDRQSWLIDHDAASTATSRGKRQQMYA